MSNGIKSQIIVFICLFPLVVIAESFTTQQFLNSCVNSDSYLKSVKMDVEIKTVGQRPGLKLYVTRELSYLRQGSQWRFLGQALVTKAETDDPAYKALPVSPLSVTWTDEYVLKYDGYIAFMNTNAPEMEKFKRWIEFDATLCSVFYGKFQNDAKSIYQLLSESNDLSVSQQPEIIMGAECYKLSGTTDYGRITAWISPENSYLTVKWQVEKTEGDLLFDNQRATVNHTFIYEVLQLSPLNNISVITKARFLDSCEDGYRTEHTYTITDIVVNPADKVEPILPEGTRVQIDTSPAIKYIWKNGKIEPQDVGMTLESIDQQINKLKQ